jgi:hypothetical protein
MVGIVVAVVVLVVAVAIAVAGAARSGGTFERIARCRSGHLFTSTVVPGASIKAVRLGRVRFQRCPVGGHWTLVAWVDPSTLSPDELAQARAHHDVPLP